MGVKKTEVEIQLNVNDYAINTWCTRLLNRELICIEEIKNLAWRILRDGLSL
jgi:hypothetical protein